MMLLNIFAIAFLTHKIILTNKFGVTALRSGDTILFVQPKTLYTMYVVSLIGKNVFHDNTIVCTITRMSNLDKIRVYIKQKYGIEFEELSANLTSGWWCFDNVTDNRDISLVVENVYTEDDIDVLLS